MKGWEILASTLTWAFVYSAGFVCGAMWCGLKRVDKELDQGGE